MNPCFTPVEGQRVVLDGHPPVLGCVVHVTPAPLCLAVIDIGPGPRPVVPWAALGPDPYTSAMTLSTTTEGGGTEGSPP